MTPSGGVPVPAVGTSTETEPEEAGRAVRHATWLELFFDLVFVAAIAELTHGLAAHPDAGHAALFVLLFVPTYLVWLNVSYYADLFDTDDRRSRATLVAAMLGGLVLATSVQAALEGETTGFVLAYLALRVFLAALYLRVAVVSSTLRPFAGRFAVGYAVGATLWGLSLTIPAPARYWLWIVALVVEVTTPAVAYLTAARTPTQESHMPERFGLFTIVALGETIVAVVAGLTEAIWTPTTVASALAAFGLAVALWWLYFDRIDESVTTRSVRGDRRATVIGLAYSYGHYAIAFGIATTGVGTILAIEAAVVGESWSSLGRALLTGGVGTYLFGTVVAFGAVGTFGVRAVTARVVSIVGLVALWVLAPALPTAVTIAVVVAGLTLLWVTENGATGRKPTAHVADRE